MTPTRSLDLAEWHDCPACPSCSSPSGVPIESADWNHRANLGDRIVCPACGSGWVGTAADVKRAQKAQAAWEPCSTRGAAGRGGELRPLQARHPRTQRRRYRASRPGHLGAVPGGAAMTQATLFDAPVRALLTETAQLRARVAELEAQLAAIQKPRRASALTRADNRRLNKQAEKLLALLRQGPLTNAEMLAVTGNHTARLSELRQMGYRVECKRLGGGVFEYRLAEVAP